MARTLKLPLRTVGVLLYPFVTYLAANRLGYAVLIPLYLPVFLNLLMLGVFFRSLRTECSMIEQFAVRIHSRGRPGRVTLSGERRAYCRKVTILWCILFFVNALVSFLLAITDNLSLWSLHTGLLAHLLMGALLLGEYLFRRYRFRGEEGIYRESESQS